MNILLINSPVFDRKIAMTEKCMPPFGILYLYSQLIKEAGIHIDFCDFYKDNITPEEFQGKFTDNYDFIGINVFSTNCSLVRDMIETYQGRTTFILGGAGIGGLRDDILTWKSNNKIILIIGESDLIINDVIHNSVKIEPDIIHGNITVYNISVSNIYFPHEIDGLILDRKFIDKNYGSSSIGVNEKCIITSRGCPYKCTFCGASKIDGKVRCRSRDSIISEIKEIRKIDPSTKSIRILDDIFLYDRASILKAVDIFSCFNLQWRAMSHVKSLAGNIDLFPLLIESGCSELFIGIESGADSIRERIKKVGTSQEVETTIKKALDAGINIKGYIMYGLPHETYDNMLETKMLVRKLFDYANGSKGKIRVSVFQFRPYHGTIIFDQIKEEYGSDILYRENNSLDVLTGRKPVNFYTCNYSDCSDEILNNFIISTQRMNVTR